MHGSWWHTISRHHLGRDKHFVLGYMLAFPPGPFKKDIFFCLPNELEFLIYLAPLVLLTHSDLLLLLLHPLLLLLGHWTTLTPWWPVTWSILHRHLLGRNARGSRGRWSSLV